MIYLKDKQTNEIKTFEVDNYLQLSKNIRDQYIEAIKEEINNYLLQEAKNKKIAELEVFHESDEARILTINEKFQVSTNYETTRKWFNEIINDLENESDVTGKSHDEITFEWEIAIGVWLPLKLSQLKQFKYAVFNITRVNFKQYRTHIKAIESLTTKTKVKNYNFKKDYLLNNKLNFDL
jgi:hypothetical protein